MAFYYNMTNLTSASGTPMGMFQEVNVISGYILGIMIMMAIFIILIVRFKGITGIRTIMMVAFFICALLSLLLSVVGIVPEWMTYIFIIGTGATVVASMFQNPEG